MSTQPSLSILIPCYNEEATVARLLERVLEVYEKDLLELQGFESAEIILIDDASTDGTAQILRDFQSKVELLPIILLTQTKNRGKGAALRKGLEHAKGKWVLIQDADLEYFPEDYPLLLQPLLESKTRVVYGSRILHAGNTTHSALRFYFGGRFLTWLSNLLFGLKLTDEPTCYKVFERSVLEEFDLVCERFEFCPELTAKLARSNISILEVPIRYKPRRPEEGKKINWQDGIEAIWTLLRWRIMPFRKKS
jgi:glycosyltransferase involved in cell wall biosynthesis